MRNHYVIDKYIVFNLQFFNVQFFLFQLINSNDEKIFRNITFPIIYLKVEDFKINLLFK